MDVYTPILERRQEDEECPDDSKFYRCQSNLFSGCCSVNPCSKAGCPDSGNKKDDDDDNDDDAKSTTTAHPATNMRTVTVSLVVSSSLSESAMISSSVTSEVSATPTDSGTITQSITASSVASTAWTEPSVTASVLPSETAENGGGSGGGGSGGGGGLSVVEIGGIVGGIAGLLIIIALGIFLHIRRNNINLGRIFRLRDNAVDLTDFELQDHTVHGISPVVRDFNNPYGDPYEEPQSRYTRACAYNTGTMRNHPVNSEARANVDKTAPAMPAAPERAVTPQSRGSEAESAHSNTFSDDHRAVSREDVTQNESSRAFTTTPEVYGPLQTAQLAELRAAGLPRFIEISRTNPPRAYQPYRPGVQVHGEAKAGTNEQVQAKAQAPSNGSGVRGDLNATAEDRNKNNYVNSWSSFDPDTTR